MPDVLGIGAKATGEDWRDHYRTPPDILRAVEHVFPFYYDPCPANPDFDGLSVWWPPEAYINPPFGDYGKWAAWGLRQPGPQIWMCNTNNASSWYQELLRASSAMVLFSYRVKFIDPRTGAPAKRPANHTTVFFRDGGADPSQYLAFKQQFSQFGYFIDLR